MDPEPPYEVLALRFGTLEATRGELLMGIEDEPEARRPLRLDFFFWLVRNGRRAFLVDTGFSAASGGARGRTMLRDPVAALRALHDPGALDGLLLTHLHYDHTGNLEMAGAAPVMVAEAERRFWASGPLAGEPGSALVEPGDLDRLARLEEQGRVRQIGGAETVIAPGLRAFRCGGHTPGQLVVEVEADRGPVILTSDALHLYEELDGSCLFTPAVEVEAARDAVSWLRRRAGAGATIVPGHDPLVGERFEAVGEDVFRVG